MATVSLLDIDTKQCREVSNYTELQSVELEKFFHTIILIFSC